MAPHSSTLAWEIPWTEEPGRLQSMGSLSVRHDWATSLSLFTFMHWRRKWQPTPVFLPGESQGRGSLVGCCGLLSVGSHRVGHDWRDLAAAVAVEVAGAVAVSKVQPATPATVWPQALKSNEVGMATSTGCKCWAFSHHIRQELLRLVYQESEQWRILWTRGYLFEFTAEFLTATWFRSWSACSRWLP